MTVEEVSRPIVLVLSQLQTELFKSRSSIDLLVKTLKNTAKQPFLPAAFPVTIGCVSVKCSRRSVSQSGSGDNSRFKASLLSPRKHSKKFFG